MLKGRKFKGMMVMLLSVCLVFVFSSSVFAAQTNTGTYSFTGKSEAIITYTNITNPSINVTTTPTSGTSDLIVQLQQNINGTWTNAVSSWNSGTTTDTCALNYNGTGTFRIVFTTNNNTSTLQGSYSITKW
ncbi:hypothetical protein JI735_22905 [Paenibacillus sonchi]|uniref:Uncharacterized protein n=1 Tax=Paenibacillus sonchi TaxID=373687 RepID=A0A974P900_9BACL|nr:hypothetical protein [Paenibacillus sonchi]QQZ59480.1 hypothetical protein JI735_22905 [Paenibacillus sonchi]